MDNGVCLYGLDHKVGCLKNSRREKALFVPVI